MTPEELAKLLNQPEVRGQLMKDLAFIEMEMDMLLMFYFTTNRRYEPFLDLVVSRLGFNDKVSIIENLPFKKNYKSANKLKIIRQLQQVRNLAAHSTYLTERDKKIQNSNWRHLFKDYPKNYNKAVQDVRASIGRLINTKEVLDHFKFVNSHSKSSQQDASKAGASA
ncbi:hypothetical protein [Zhongshania marina]